MCYSIINNTGTKWTCRLYKKVIKSAILLQDGIPCFQRLCASECSCALQVSLVASFSSSCDCQNQTNLQVLHQKHWLAVMQYHCNLHRCPSTIHMRTTITDRELHVGAKVQLPVTHTHTSLTDLYPGLPGKAGTRKVKPINNNYY